MTAHKASQTDVMNEPDDRQPGFDGLCESIQRTQERLRPVYECGRNQCDGGRYRIATGALSVDTPFSSKLSIATQYA